MYSIMESIQMLMFDSLTHVSWGWAKSPAFVWQMLYNFLKWIAIEVSENSTCNF